MLRFSSDVIEKAFVHSRLKESVARAAWTLVFTLLLQIITGVSLHRAPHQCLVASLSRFRTSLHRGLSK